ncbi:sigma-70 family RNA polymerase sigma factor [Frankia sp. CNm7]|uniref:Sigma-70 family RNA polymerase sigma factor n=1 Tax=Frankia nepalensis TaxID=1836974 RepID=A0A937UNM9_9ACTN|nr:sigma-70 family RNA polymerase sigma factor [Frankia nepalensis]MBL7501529.1 sigma-70 family RNA polymerase sigma factor [Frankia nepalensis]MBL7515300.1 sigma-70 family RNA polymerase sigma factor [Frankia nepalensis]MBL7523578.1 sigma-70 family RNA polymerase sigma factor [Frankia nepalensis]MBL7630029.1 sigma-70 family RNA polymerase sigma factor [Frankia nepalensis]
MTQGTSVVTRADLEDQLAGYRSELTGYCYRMLGSPFEAEDAVQETMIRAWRNLEKFEGRASLRTWLYRIATNVCSDLAAGRARRARPIDLTGPSEPAETLRPPLPEATWVVPSPDGSAPPGGAVGGGGAADPADVVAARDSVRLALIVALQRLAPRQRAVLILREVLGWSAAETAELLDTTVASVNSALQRARATLAAAQVAETDPVRPGDDEQRELLARYVAAFESYDMTALTALLHEDATMTMPPLDLWLRGPEDIVAFMLGTGGVCRNSKLVPTIANGGPAFGHYHVVQPGEAELHAAVTGGEVHPLPEEVAEGGYVPWSLIVLETSDGKITGVNHFLDTDRLFPLFGLPPFLEA